ncbi:MAG: hypothetical protein BGO03_01790 [Mesorhizobium sp. 61-13]|nr:MAG: hypothetical protein BGO03_01790 [Mesorhizobium sp. 61-13]
MNASQLDAAIDVLEDALEKLRALREPRVTLAHIEPAAFRNDDLVEAHVAAKRFQMAEDTIRHWCRTYEIGVKRGGRWLVSIEKLRARIGQ